MLGAQFKEQAQTSPPTSAATARRSITWEEGQPPPDLAIGDAVSFTFNKVSMTVTVNEFAKVDPPLSDLPKARAIGDEVPPSGEYWKAELSVSITESDQSPVDPNKFGTLDEDARLWYTKYAFNSLYKWEHKSLELGTSSTDPNTDSAEHRKLNFAEQKTSNDFEDALERAAEAGGPQRFTAVAYVLMRSGHHDRMWKGQKSGENNYTPVGVQLTLDDPDAGFDRGTPTYAPGVKPKYPELVATWKLPTK